MRKIICIITLIAMLVFSLNTFAAAPEDIYKEYKFYTATVYICDVENNRVILRNVKPINPLDGLVNARAIEYTSVKINSNCIYDKNGNRISLEMVNESFLDIEAKVLTGKSNRGQRVLYIGF